MSDVTLAINGVGYGGWEGIRITRSIESLAGSFSLDAFGAQADEADSWPIEEEDACEVKIDGETVITGYMDRPTGSFSAASSSRTFAGRDKSAALVDCSALLSKWSFRGATIVDVARTVASAYGVSVSVQPGLELLKAPRKLVVNPGDTGFDVILAAAKPAGVIVVSDGVGGILITRAGTERASQPLIQGEAPFIGCSYEYDASSRFYRYVVMSQVAGSDGASGNATRIRAEAIDEGVKRLDRALIIRPESGQTVDYARQLGDWEARIRAANARAATITVHGWRQSDGKLWPINALVSVKSKRLRIDGEMLISQADHAIDSGGEITALRIVRPDAFTPEPAARVRG